MPGIKFDPSFTQKAEIYINASKKEKRTPTIKGFAEFLKTDDKSILAWAGKKEKDKQGKETDKLARPEFNAVVKTIELMDQNKREKGLANLRRGNPGNKGPAPFIYGPEIIEKANKYLNDSVDKYTKVRFKYRFAVNLPTAEGLALYLNIHRTTLYDWSDKYPEFADILEKLNQIQASRVISNSLSGDYNPLISKLLLGKHGYKEKSDITSDDEKLPFTVVSYKGADRGK